MSTQENKNQEYSLEPEQPETPINALDRFENMVKNLTKKATQDGSLRVYAVDLLKDNKTDGLLDENNSMVLTVATTVDKAKKVVAEVTQELNNRRASQSERSFEEVALFIRYGVDSDDDLFERFAEEVSNLSSLGRSYNIYCIISNEFSVDNG